MFAKLNARRKGRGGNVVVVAATTENDNNNNNDAASSPKEDFSLDALNADTAADLNVVHNNNNNNGSNNRHPSNNNNNKNNMESPRTPKASSSPLKKKTVGWSHDIFVADPTILSSDDDIDDDEAAIRFDDGSTTTNDDDDDDDTTTERDDSQSSEFDYSVTAVPSRTSLGFARALSKRQALVLVDAEELTTRQEWSELLVEKALTPYKQMICAVDNDLPNPNELAAMEQDATDYLKTRKAYKHIRNEMMDDPDLTEKEVAAFFQGMKLMQLKCNSLKSQLQGMKTLQRAKSWRPGLDASLSVSMRDGLVRSTGTGGAAARGLFRHPSMPDTTSPSKQHQQQKQQQQINHHHDHQAVVPTTIAEGVQSPMQSMPSSVDAGGATGLSAPPLIELPSPSTARSLLPATTTKKEAKSNQSEERMSPTKTAASPRFGGLQRRGDESSSSSTTAKKSRSLRQMSICRIRETTHHDNNDIQKLLHELEEAERRQQKLEKQLASAGVVIAEDIPYEVAKAKVQEIAARMTEIGGSDNADKKLQEEYFRLEQDMEKYTAALELTDEWAEEQENMEREWEASVEPANQQALKRVRRHMPVDVRNMSEAALHTQPAPNGKYLPKTIAKKFKRTNVLQLLRIDPDDIIPMHAATLENLRVTGLTLTERRALYEHLRQVGPRWKAMQGDKMTQRKWTWYSMMKSNFKENVDAWQRHVDQYGPPDNHPYASRDNPAAGGCPLLGKQCPLKADKLIDYTGDYGYPDGPEYFKTEVKKSDVDNASKAKQEAQEALKLKKAEERRSALKEHYKGKILQVSLANGSCESMDDAMINMENLQEKWIKARLTNGNVPAEDSRKKEVSGFNEALNDFKLSILQFAERSGMQLTGKRDASVDKPDIRSMIELSLCEEVIESATDFFQGIEDRMKEMGSKDGRMSSTIKQLRTLLDELHERNLETMESLGQARLPRSRELKSRSMIAAQVKKALASEEKAIAAKPTPTADQLADSHGGGGGGGRGNLLAALEVRGGRGRGGRGGRGDLLSALKGRGRGSGEEAAGPGRGDLLAALKGRGRGRGGGGRGDFLSAIQGRGRGGDG